MMNAKQLPVAILGLSDREDRYAFMVYKKLLQYGHTSLFGLSIKALNLLQISCFNKSDDIPAPVHTVTLYMGQAHTTPLIEKIIALKPNRIIFNPGTENELLEIACNKAGIEVIHGCTLVMLSTDQF